MVSMARPFLADPEFVKKAKEGRVDEINTCIGCNQACLDHTFGGKRASCLVNPRAGYETSLVLRPVEKSKVKNIGVIGAGPAGLAFATNAARRGHKVTLFEKDSAIGGQFNMAKLVPGKEEFHETLRYYQKQIELTGVNLKLNHNVAGPELNNFDSVVIATGVLPREISLPNKSTGKVSVVSYVDVLRNKAPVGKRVAVIGAGGIGFDVADLITHDGHHAETAPKPFVDESEVDKFLSEWGVDKTVSKGGLNHKEVVPEPPRKVYLMQRKTGKLGASLGKTTGWVHRATLKKRQVEELSGCKYIEVNDNGIVIERNGKQETIAVDTVILCAGQVPLRALQAHCDAERIPSFMIGGAWEAAELDAKRAVDQATRLAAVIEDARPGDIFEAPVDMKTKIMAKMLSMAK